jgi:hypothetical protein
MVYFPLCSQLDIVKAELFGVDFSKSPSILHIVRTELSGGGFFNSCRVNYKYFANAHHRLYKKERSVVPQPDSSMYDRCIRRDVNTSYLTSHLARRSQADIACLKDI